MFTHPDKAADLLDYITGTNPGDDMPVLDILRSEPDAPYILTSFIINAFLRENIEHVKLLKTALLAVPVTDNAISDAVSKQLQAEIDFQYGDAGKAISDGAAELFNDIVERFKKMPMKKLPTMYDARVRDLLDATQGPEMDLPISDLLREIIARFTKSKEDQVDSSDEVADSEALKEGTEYLLWLETGKTTSEPPKSQLAVDLGAASQLVSSKNPSDKIAGRNKLVQVFTAYQDLLATTYESTERVDYGDTQAVGSTSGNPFQTAIDDAMRTSEQRVFQIHNPNQASESTVSGASRIGDAFAGVGRRLSNMPGIGALSRVAVKTRTALGALTEPVMSANIGSSAVCEPDDSNASDLQILIRTAIDHTDRYLTTQYQMFGMWAVFNLGVICVIVFLVYRTFRVLLSYFQILRELRKTRAMPKSNDIFNPDDDNDHYPVDPQKIAKNRVPSGAAIESRLMRLSKETGLDVRGAIDPSGDKYDKPVIDDDDDDYKYYSKQTRV